VIEGGEIPVIVGTGTQIVKRDIGAIHLTRESVESARLWE
jgi:hypothetical protein